MPSRKEIEDLLTASKSIHGRALILIGLEQLEIQKSILATQTDIISQLKTIANRLLPE
jgi:hypothetical protein